MHETMNNEHPPVPIKSENSERYLDLTKISNAGERSVELDVWALPDFMRDYLEIASKHTDAEFGALLTAWLPAIAVNIGNRVWIRGNGKHQFCHIWSMLVGPSTVTRKSTCMRLAARTLLPYQEKLRKLDNEEREIKQLVLHNVTNSKLVSLLAKNANRQLEFHELASLLKNSGLKFNAGMKENLTAFYDGDSKIHANQDRTEFIENPALSIIAASTPGWVYQGFDNSAEQASGFLQRFIYCVIAPKGKDFDSDPEFSPPPMDDLHAYDAIFDVFRCIPGDFELHVDLAERKQWMKEHDRVLNIIRRNNDDVLLEYASRIYNNVCGSLMILITMMKKHRELKQAILNRRCKEFFAELRVDGETVHEALCLCDYYLQNAIPMINIVKEGGAWNNERRILKHLAGKGKGEDSHSNIMNTLHIKARDIQECMRNLTEQDLVEIYQYRSRQGAKAIKMYRLIAKTGAVA
jgi:hypothetical protein